MSNIKLTKSQVQIRTATEGDVGFLFNSWLKSYKAAAFSKYISNPVYFDMHHKVIEGILKRAQVLIACNPTDNNQIYGYLCFEVVQDTTVLHYCYTKEAFRNMGILQLLLADVNLPAAFFYSHSTVSSANVVPKLKQNAIYNPYLAFMALVV